MANKRFRDQNFRLSDFNDLVWIKCPSCKCKAIAKANFESKIIRALCNTCGYNKEISSAFGKTGQLIMAAHNYFNADLWLQAPFKDEIFFAYNDAHLLYLEQYIVAELREHKDRTHFTLLEKLPKFYHEAKNRASLVKLIQKLKKENGIN
jgi:hypothetical protein